MHNNVSIFFMLIYSMKISYVVEMSASIQSTKLVGSLFAIIQSLGLCGALLGLVSVKLDKLLILKVKK